MGIDIAGLVDTRRGLIGRRIFIEPEIYEQELARIFRPLLAVFVPREPDPAAGRLLHSLYGRRPGPGDAR
jgi:hypothetical protein